jgi:hypothetical protein
MIYLSFSSFEFFFFDWPLNGHEKTSKLCKDPTGDKNAGMTTTLFGDNLGEAAEDEKGEIV